MSVKQNPITFFCVEPFKNRFVVGIQRKQQYAMYFVDEHNRTRYNRLIWLTYNQPENYRIKPYFEFIMGKPHMYFTFFVNKE